MNFNSFFKQNAKVVENKKVTISERFIKENGEVEIFEIRAISAQDDQLLRENCTIIKDINGQKIPMIDSVKYQAMLCAACVVYPELGNAELQDSYGVKTKQDLLTSMLLPAEFQDLATEVNKVNGFKTLGELTKEAKN
ncbi:phage tail assembly chaperone [Fusobacterium mortiferum]|uniref:phage tail assembly chaperone n=1 Tax=Fusobacterium mortiferum TaxID=850 RepID=UPI00195EB7D1|nr:phage portal protein [Fusobacterium mortiferum]